MVFNKFMGWCSVGGVFFSVELKWGVREKILVFVVVGFNEGVVNCYLVVGSFNVFFIINVIEYYFFLYLLRDSFLVFDNVLIYDDVVV